MRSLCFLLFSAIVYSCAESSGFEGIEIPLAERQVAAKLEEVKIPPVLFRERKITLSNDYLFTLSATKDTLIRVFDRQTLEYLGGFGIEGGGPDDYKPIASGFQGIGDDLLHVAGLKVNKTLRFKKTPGSSPKFSTEIVEAFRVPGELAPWNNTFKINDTIYAGTKYFESDKELTTVHTKTSEIGSLIPFPDYAPHISPEYKHNLYQRMSKYTYAQQKLVTAYIFFPSFRIYDFQTQETKEVHVKPDFEQLRVSELGDGINLNLSDLYTYYRKIETSDNYIYALYRIESGPNTGSHVLSNNELHIFDFDGNLVHNMRLEEWMTIFVIAPDDEYIYFWHPDVEDVLYRYPLEGLLNREVNQP